MTKQERTRLAYQIAEVLAKKIVAVNAELRRRKLAKKRVAARERRLNGLQHSLSLLGSKKFKPSEGLYPAVAKSLGITRTTVYQVAKGMRQSPRVMAALKEEIKRRAADPLTAPITCTRKQLSAASSQSPVKGGAQ